MGQNFSPYFIAFPPGAGIARFVTDCSTIVQKLIFAFDIAFPSGGRCRRTATDEGRRAFLIFLNIFNKRFLKIKGRIFISSAKIVSLVPRLPLGGFSCRTAV